MYIIDCLVSYLRRIYDLFFQIKNMKAAVVTAFKKPLEIKQVAIPKPGPNDVLVKNIACGVCHTDLHAIRGGKIELKIIDNSFFFSL
jgi:hypothetical protein